MRNLLLALTLTVFSATFHTGCAALQQYMGNSDGEGITTQQVVGGLYDALTVSSKRAVGETSKDGGFLNNPLIRLAIPSQLEPFTNAARKIGLNKQVDNLVKQMNHAAELATGAAIDVLVNTIKGITFQDAWAILNGNETAATDYFRARTTDELTARFSPIVNDKMKQAGVYNTYETLNGLVSNLPFERVQGFDLQRFIVDEALKGLFKTVAQEEAKIRSKVNFRTTPALKEVFGFLDDQRAQGKRAEPSAKESNRGNTGARGGKVPQGTVQ